MEIEFDPAKDAANQTKHGLSLAEVVKMDWDNAVILPDTRFSYGEPRFRAYGYIDGRMHMVAFTIRGEKVRPISFRKANAMEIKRHG